MSRLVRDTKPMLAPRQIRLGFSILRIMQFREVFGLRLRMRSRLVVYGCIETTFKTRQERTSSYITIFHFPAS